ncbi:MAG: DMT family transporter [Lachnospiraceae bacterium]|jgi:drug/metabolite transporter (DMT)-like permease|nr:DMT family transporter [Lachnospiraceae bacterium]
MNKKTNTILTKTPMVCLLAMICCLLWGSAFPCIKIGYQLFQIHPDSIGSQLLFAGCRFTLAGILTILIGSLLNRRFLLPAKTSWSMVAKLGLVQTVLQYILFYIGLANTTGVKSSIIEASNVFLAILAATLIFKLEKLTPAKIAGCILGFAGVVIINLNGGSLDTSMSFSGEGCILLSAAAYALSSILIKRYAQKDEPVTLSGYQFLFGGVILSLIGLAAGGRVSGFTFASTALLLYLSLVSAIAYSLWGILLKFNPVGKVAVFGFMNPVFGVILSAILLGESNQAFTLTGLAALALVCAGIYIVNRHQMKPV